MGTLIYGEPGLAIEFDDRVLAHLQVVIAAKLRRNEGFLFSWRGDEPGSAGRTCIWMHASIPVRFVYDSPEPPDLNRTWLDVLAMSSHTAAGLRVVEEPAEAPSAPRVLP